MSLVGTQRDRDRQPRPPTTTAAVDPSAYGPSTVKVSVPDCKLALFHTLTL
jgi:hypothetical protein